MFLADKGSIFTRIHACVAFRFVLLVVITWDWKGFACSFMTTMFIENRIKEWRSPKWSRSLFGCLFWHHEDAFGGWIQFGFLFGTNFFPLYLSFIFFSIEFEVWISLMERHLSQMTNVKRPCANPVTATLLLYICTKGLAPTNVSYDINVSFIKCADEYPHSHFIFRAPIRM